MTLTASLLWPFSLPYAAAASMRAHAYEMGFLRQRHLERPVISVGNLTVGGTGKTPMVLWIAQRLLLEGKRVGILTRGYKGDSEGDAKDAETRKTGSDEVRLLKARLGSEVAFGVGADRHANGKRLAKEGVEWFVLDDGFQHLQLARDVDIVLIDATNPFGGGKVLPAGRLREPRSALRRADMVVITRSEHAPAVETIVRRYSDAPIFYAQPQLDNAQEWRGRYPGEEERDARWKKLFAFCGIGNADALFANLREWGFTVVGQKSFRDHHRYTQKEANEIEQEAGAVGADALICTEKDIFNLDGASFAKYPILYCSISMRVSKEDDFWSAILEKVAVRSASVYP